MVYPAVAMVGLATYLAAYGVDHAIGTSSYWDMPQQDERMALMGYRYFLLDEWNWPLFVNHSIDVPYTTSVAFHDSIPLWALINKVVSTLIPPWETFSHGAFLALWHALVYALQACFGVACVRSLGHRSWRAGLVTAFFVLAVPAWIFRYGHPALSAHWIELWALWLYLRTPTRAPLPWRLGIESLAQLAVAAMITPYHPVMSLGFLTAALLKSRSVRSIAVWLPLWLASVAIATWFAGYIAGEGAVRQWGFEHQSTNLLSWLVPVRSGIIGDGRWIANVMATDWQYEGYAYLGLGYLALLAGCLSRPRIVRDAIRHHSFLFVIACAFGVLALSNHIYFGGDEVFTYRIPRLMRWVTGQFRAPGRLVWVPMYVLIVFLLHWGFTRFSSSRGFVVMLALAAIQVLDARGDWALQRAWTTGPQANAIDRTAWRPFVHAHEAVQVHPTNACIGGDQAPFVFDAAMGVQMLASERAIPINGTYSTRTTRKCNVEERGWATMMLRPDTLYVLLPQAFALAERLASQGASCANLNIVRVCSSDAIAFGAAVASGAIQLGRDAP